MKRAVAPDAGVGEISNTRTAGRDRGVARTRRVGEDKRRAAADIVQDRTAGRGGVAKGQGAVISIDAVPAVCRKVSAEVDSSLLQS